MIDKFKEIHDNGGINPRSGKNYHVSDLVDVTSFPEKYWFNRIFGSMTNDGAEITSYFGTNKVELLVVDRNVMNHYKENYISEIVTDHPNGSDMYRIRAIFNNETRISIIFYNYELYQKMSDKIFK